MFRISKHGPLTRIHMAPCLFGRPMLWVSVFHIDGLLIDSGCTHTVPDLLRALETEGLHVEQLIHTHTHEDHVGGDARLREVYGVTPRVHPLGLARLAAPETAAELQFYRRVAWGAVEACPGEPLGDFVQTDRYRFTLIHTPGHADDHVALFEEREGWLFSGDLLVSPNLPRIRREEDPTVTIASLRRAAALPARKLFCSHAHKVWDSPEPLSAKAARWERLQGEAERLAAGGWPAKAIARRLLGPDELIEWISLGDLSKRNLIDRLLEGGTEDVSA